MKQRNELVLPIRKECLHRGRSCLFRMLAITSLPLVIWVFLSLKFVDLQIFWIFVTERDRSLTKSVTMAIRDGTWRTHLPSGALVTEIEPGRYFWHIRYAGMMRREIAGEMRKGENGVWIEEVCKIYSLTNKTGVQFEQEEEDGPK